MGAQMHEQSVCRALLAALLSAARMGGVGACGLAFVAPPNPGNNVALHNGVVLQDVCIQGPGPFHAFVIGDWGGLGVPPKAADDGKRPRVDAVDDVAQQRVATQMAIRAATSKPDYVLNAGDNFYWGGVNSSCLNPQAWTEQWSTTFETVYRGFGLDGKPWLGVLGNHDYGGWMYSNGWTQTIAKTWQPGSRWMTPAQYWAVKVFYPSFTVDYLFTDSNVFDAHDPSEDPAHNICSKKHNEEVNCAACGGPASVSDCPRYFQALWDAQQPWLEARLSASTADWQVVVTHFPPTFGLDVWKALASKHGIDLFVSGHVHQQRVYGPDDPDNAFASSASIVSGGGGGIQSSAVVDVGGNDDSYGFIDLTLDKAEITITAITHGGQVRTTKRLRPRSAAASPAATNVVSAATADLSIELRDMPERLEDAILSGQGLARGHWPSAVGVGLIMALAFAVAKRGRLCRNLRSSHFHGLLNNGEAHVLITESIPQ
mmetsp:Transcript_103802/g.289100  ORF Transcript_103802/g.289100 Transcript_103802/m.289100 type:complete len:487 (+) Transcript_103802:42-1502(+)|eukprot:CAMPEP_0179045586 /NCGR_PEP_ID=MMETSP0796-20121207/18253_1 /TAXON_ID=73915 /ORGANISM="Pyrodinium bahamense, Strain pbaha01" /LENGTH=486 /DNA_ID=CAMNT_0020741995 /DNA_START=39 /DNA_END=1499 /DNA_ORIENTATION=-